MSDRKFITAAAQRIFVGSHLRVSRGTYSHHGIYVGRRRMIHFSGKADGLLSGAGPVVYESLNNFFLGAERAELVSHQNPLPPTEIVARAREKLKSADYSLFFNNCEHFATWCVTGKARSSQIDDILEYGPIEFLIRQVWFE
jgi:hypothetical protein